jgi:hypothetical protein
VHVIGPAFALRFPGRFLGGFSAFAAHIGDSLLLPGMVITGN